MQRELYYRYYSFLMRICIRYTADRHEAEQWAHDSFLRIYQNLGQYEGKGTFEGWIKKITVNICIDQLRKFKAQKNEVFQNTFFSVKDIESTAPYIDNSVVQKIQFDDLIDLLKDLPPKQRTAFNLYVFEGYEYSEIAETLDITPNHCYWLLFQARKALRKKLTSSHKREELSHE